MENKGKLVVDALARLLRANTSEPGDIRAAMKQARAVLRSAGVLPHRRRAIVEAEPQS